MDSNNEYSSDNTPCTNSYIDSYTDPYVESYSDSYADPYTDPYTNSDAEPQKKDY
ncbi:15761_t:CDS:2 [Racocetra fulgida]|uniref:15761_t:CDS:1 n=1 Tax=Racocetra fulgida TaxID=60492 RepID=A0A9N9JWF3_9GLOM|nr:15761_t:CDS:2 [Racocetra fulgida]